MASPPVLYVQRQVLGGVVFRQSPLVRIHKIPHQAGGDGRGAESGAAELAVPVRPDGVVDTRNDLLDVEDMARDLSRHDVAVIALGDGKEHLSALDTAAAENIA